MSKKIVLVSSNTCSLCPTAIKVAEEVGIKNNVEVQVLKVEEDFDRLMTMSIRSVPTAIILNDNTEVSRYTGLTQVQSLKSLSF